jgi:hypothetical protein
MAMTALCTANESETDLMLSVGSPNPVQQRIGRELKAIDKLLLLMEAPEANGYTLEEIASDASAKNVLKVHRHCIQGIRYGFQLNRRSELYIAQHSAEQLMPWWKGFTDYGVHSDRIQSIDGRESTFGIDSRVKVRPNGSDKPLRAIVVDKKDGTEGLMYTIKYMPDTYMERMMRQLGHSFGIAATFEALLSDNRQLMEMMETYHITSFLNMIKSHGPEGKFVRFFKAMCTDGASAVVGNQENVLRVCYSATDDERFLRNRYDMMVETALDTSAITRQWDERPEEMKKLKKECENDPEHIVAGKVLFEGMHDVVVSWNNTQFPSAEAIGLASAVNPNVPDPTELAKYKSRAGITDTQTWVKLEDLLAAIPAAGHKKLGGKKYNKDHVRLAEYYVCVTELYAELCADRSYNCISVLEQQFSFELLITGISDNRFSPRARTTFADLMARIYLNRFPHETMELPRLARVYGDVKHLTLEDNDALPSFNLPEDSPSRQMPEEIYRIAHSDKFLLLEHFMSTYLNDCNRQVMDCVDDNNLTTSVLVNLQLLTEFGFFGDKEEIRTVMDPIATLLDGREDVFTESQAADYDRDNKEADPETRVARARAATVKRQSLHQRLSMTASKKPDAKVETLTDSSPNLERYLLNHSTKNCMATKVRMCNVFSVVADIRLDFRISFLLNYFKNGDDHDSSTSATIENSRGPIHVENTEEETEPFNNHIREALLRRDALSGQKNPGQLVAAGIGAISGALGGSSARKLHSLNGLENETCLTAKAFHDFEKLFLETTKPLDLDEICVCPLVTSCLDLMQYECPELFRAAFRTIARQFGQREALLNAFNQLQILVEEDSVAAFKVLNEKLALLRNDLDSYETWGEQSPFSSVNEQTISRVKGIFVELRHMCTHPDDAQPHRANQELLRNVGAQFIALQALRITGSSGGGSTIAEHLLEIKMLANAFLEKYLMSNKPNQAALATDENIELFLGTIQDGVQVSRVLCALYTKNHELCSVLPAEVVSVYSNAIAGQKDKALYLELIEFFNNVISPEDSPIMENQNHAVKVLADLENFPTYVEHGKSQEAIQKSKSYKHRLELMRQFEPDYAFEVDNSRRSSAADVRRPRSVTKTASSADATQQVVYHAKVVELLALCCAGRNTVVEVKCHRMIPFDHCMEVLRNSETVPVVRRAFCNFLKEAYFDTDLSEFPTRSRKDPAMWEVLSIAADCISKYQEAKSAKNLEDADGLLSFSESKIDNGLRFEEECIFAGIFPMLTSFFETIYDPLYTQNKTVVEHIETSLRALLCSGVVTEAQRNEIVKCGVAMGVYSRDLADVLLTPAPDESSNGVSVQDRLATFKSALSNTMEIQEAVELEFYGLVDSVEKIETLTDPFDDEWQKQATAEARADRRIHAVKLTVEKVVRRMVRYFTEQNGLCDQDTNVSIKAIRLLRKMLERLEPAWWDEDLAVKYEDMHVEVKEAKEEEFTARQNDFAEWGVLEMIVQAFSLPNIPDEVVIETLQLAIQMLNHGNLNCQTAFYELLVESKNEDFFASIHTRIQRSMDMVNRRRLRQQWRQTGAFDLNEDVGEDVDGVRMDLLGRMMQLFAEGHNRHMQDLMRNQSSLGFRESYDLVTQMVNLLSTIARDEITIRNLTDGDCEDLSQVLDYLIEIVQGPCPQNQVALATNVKLVDTCKMVMATTCLTKDEERSHELRKDIKANAVKLLGSLLEGRLDNVVHDSLLDKLDTDSLRTRVVKVFEEYGELKESMSHDSTWDERFLEEGFDLKRMSDCLGVRDPVFAAKMEAKVQKLEPRNYYRDTKTYKDASKKYKKGMKYKEAKTFFDSKVRSIEVYWEADAEKKLKIMDRIYFPESSECKYFSAELKNEMLRITKFGDEERLRDFAKLADNVKDKMQHKEYLQNFLLYRGVGVYVPLLKKGSYYLALMMNFIMLVSLERTPGQGQKYSPLYMETVQLTLGIIQIITSSMVLTYLLTNRAPIVYKRTLKEFKRFSESSVMELLDPSELVKMSQERLMELYNAFMPAVRGTAGFLVLMVLMHLRFPDMTLMYLLALLLLFNFGTILAGFANYFKNPEAAKLYYPISLVYRVGFEVLTNGDTLFYAIYVLCAVLGVTVGGYYYCFHLLDLIVMSPSLQNVVQSVMQPRAALGMTAILMVFTVYIFSMIGFYAFPLDFYNADNGIDECGTMITCFFTFLHSGLLAGGGIGDYISGELGYTPQLSGDSFYDSGNFGMRMFFDLGFFIIVLVLLMNIVFGIILETFSTLRETAKDEADVRATRCFICGLEKSDFDEKMQEESPGEGNNEC